MKTGRVCKAASKAKCGIFERDKEGEKKILRRSLNYVEGFFAKPDAVAAKNPALQPMTLCKRALIAPSILSADFSKLGDEIKAVEKADAGVIHIDVMDGHFVPNITIGPPVVAKIRKTTKLPFDCHLMIANPEKYVDAFAKAGADWISVHVEACNLAEVLPAIRARGLKAGCVLNPSTQVKDILPYVPLSDFVLVMTVNPGFGGQTMIETCLEKITAIKTFLSERGLSIPIEVDGGINPENAQKAINSGASILVAGNAVFGAPDYRKAIASLRGEPGK